MGLLDHQKTWGWKLRASPDECISAFADAFMKGGTLLKKAKWSISRSGSSAVATYKGRGGLVGGLTAMSQTASAEQASAEGSTVNFEIDEEASEGDKIACSMWLSSAATKLGFTADARFIRPYMQAVTSRLAAIDPNLETYRT